MDVPQIKTAGRDEQDKVLDIITLAFATDTFARWVWPDAHSYLKNFGRFTLALAGKSFDGATAFYAEDCSAAALWLAPGISADEEEMLATLLEVVPESHLEALGKMGEEIRKYHPEDPYWYLADIGVDPMMQGRGRGALMMKDMLRRCDNEKKIVYLESSNPRNISFYERHGFEDVGEILVGNPEPLTPMVRAPR
jgi:ribosomal protein S18 acetylase RimI-like enzyme